MDETTRKRLLASLPEKVNCPACAGQLVRPALVCAGEGRRCERLLGQCSEVLPYIPAGLLGPEDEPKEDADWVLIPEETADALFARGREAMKRSDEALARGREEPKPGTVTATMTAAVEGAKRAAKMLAEIGSDAAARTGPRPITLTPEEEALLHPPMVRGPGYPTPEASAEAARMNGPINRARREGRKAAAAGDREGLDLALGILTVLLETRAELRHPEPADETSTEQPEDAADFEAPASPVPAPEPPRSSLYFEVIGEQTGYRLADHLDGISRSVRPDLGQYEVEVRIRRLARNGNGRVAT